MYEKEDFDPINNPKDAKVLEDIKRMEAAKKYIKKRELEVSLKRGREESRKDIERRKEEEARGFFSPFPYSVSSELEHIYMQKPLDED